MEGKPHVLVIGDVMLDSYISGVVDRVSPEAPVPIVKVTKEWSVVGGAANVAANVFELGAYPVLFGLVGKDEAGQDLQRKISKHGIKSKLIFTNQTTIRKTRIISSQQIVRFDKEEKYVWNKHQFDTLKTNLEEFIPLSEIILVSDYAKGTLSDEVLNLIFQLSRQYKKKVLVDPKRKNWKAYMGSYLITPNIKELSMVCGKDVENEDKVIISCLRQQSEAYNLENILCTRSGFGMTLFSNNNPLNIPTRAQEVFDVSGAGDTVLATVGVMLSSGNELKKSVFLANAAAGLVVQKRGTATLTMQQLSEFVYRGNKRVEREHISLFNAKHQDKSIVFTNGCFDVLHYGHRKLLKQAKTYGDVLVVGLNSDASVSNLKGKSRPINEEVTRIEAVSALPYVDAVIVFKEDTPLELLKELKADVLVKGGDYKPESVVGKEFVSQVIIVPLVEGISTTILC